MIKTILILTLVCLPLTTYSQNQRAFSRDTELVVFKDGQRVVKAYRYANVVYDDQGREVLIVRSQKGKLKGRQNLKPGEYFVEHEGDYKKHQVSVEVKEVEPDTVDIFPAGSQVSVYVTPGAFTAEQQGAIVRALDGWNKAGRVTFQFQGEGDGQITLERKTVYIRRKEIKGVSAYSELHAETKDGVRIGKFLCGMNIWIDYRVTKPDVLQSLISHELGHTVTGQPDCQKCDSIMRVFPATNKSNGYYGPTEVDLSALLGNSVLKSKSPVVSVRALLAN